MVQVTKFFAGIRFFFGDIETAVVMLNEKRWMLGIILYMVIGELGTIYFVGTPGNFADGLAVTFWPLWSLVWIGIHVLPLFADFSWIFGMMAGTAIIFGLVYSIRAEREAARKRRTFTGR